MRRSILRLFLVALPAAVLSASLGIVLYELGPAALLASVAHENEPRSLLGIVLFPGHALRELPHVLVLTLVFGGALVPARDVRLAARQAATVLARATAFGAALFLWASLESGWRAAWVDLTQQRGAPDLLAPGVHVRLHLMSDLALALLFFGAAGLFERAGMGAIALVGMALLAGMAGVSGLAEIAHPRFVGHAAREVFAQTLVTLPLLMAWTWRRIPLEPVAALRTRWWTGGALAAGFVVTALLGLGVGRVSDVLRYSSAPGRSLALNLAAHNFEHLLDLLLLVVGVSGVLRDDDGRSGE